MAWARLEACVRKTKITALGILFLGLAAIGFAQDYEIGPGDVLKVAVLGQADMTGEFAVDNKGLLSFPFLGKVKASGMTTTELERKLTTLLAEGYLKHPHVSVSVKDFHSLRVFVTGEVQKPGPYGLKPERSLLALLGDVGDLTPGAGHEVIIIRTPKPPPTPEAIEPSPEPVATPTPQPSISPAIPLLPGEVPGSQIFHVSLREIRSGNPDKDFKLEPGDTVFFPKAAQIYVTGQVRNPGALHFEEGLTVFQAIALAGGTTDRGSAGGTRIVRFVNGKKKEFKPKPTDVVEPEDTIVVPERFF